MSSNHHQDQDHHPYTILAILVGVIIYAVLMALVLTFDYSTYRFRSREIPEPKLSPLVIPRGE